MKGDRLRHAMHRQAAENVATLRPGPFHAAALEYNLRKFLHVEEFRAPQVIIPFFDSRVDAAHVDLRRYRGIFGTLAVDLDLATESCEFPMGGTQELMHTKPNG